MHFAAFLMVLSCLTWVHSNRSAVLLLILTKMFLALFWSKTAFYSGGTKFDIAACIVSLPFVRPAIRGKATFESFGASMIAPVIVAPIRHVLLLH